MNWPRQEIKTLIANGRDLILVFFKTEFSAHEEARVPRGIILREYKAFFSKEGVPYRAKWVLVDPTDKHPQPQDEDVCLCEVLRDTDRHSAHDGVLYVKILENRSNNKHAMHF